MGVTSRDIFGESPYGLRAAVGSYGESPSGFRLPVETRLGRVKLQIADLARSIEFYEEVLGLRTTDGDASTAVLAAHDDDIPIVELTEKAGVKPVPARTRTGLFHSAILLPDRPSLGLFVKHLSAVNARAGSSDHLVSESFYLQDPDNLGIEVYADRPREEWRRVGRELMMATDPIDIGSLMQVTDGKWTGMPAGTRIGHVHLHVGDIASASSFYSEAVGFDRTVWSYPGALFLSAGGYHHHLGTNIWAGRDASRPAENEAQLLEWTIELPTATDVRDVANSLTQAGHAAQWDQSNHSVTAEDPWGTRLRVVVRETDVTSGHNSPGR
jgi:catechol 2,3-dioxygenase